MSNKVAVISGSKSDSNITDSIGKVFNDFGVEHEIRVISAHRNHDELQEYVSNSDADIFIGVAGLSAHLPGVLSALTTKPVIGVPVEAKLGGIDSLLSIAQMPPGIPVAAVGIDNGKNAALLAIAILCLNNETLHKKLVEYRKSWKTQWALQILIILWLSKAK